MHDYEKVNNEIKEFINMQETRLPLPSYTEKNEKSGKDDLVVLLTDLLDIYKDIQIMLETKDFENAKNKIISSDVKNALVCESLMKILKDECLEKAEIKDLYQNERLKIKRHESENLEILSKCSKLESDLDFLKRSNAELSRVIKDQKNLLISAKEKAELERKACESIKNVNKELEILRHKAYERVQTFEKEMSILKNKIAEKEKNVKETNLQNKEINDEKKELTKKILDLEKKNEASKMKYEIKENALEICNAELVKMINKNKKNEEMLEEINEKAAYYEKLYKATNKQNEYLNEQLAKMINITNVNKFDNEGFLVKSDASLLTTQSKEHEYKHRIKKYKKKYKLHKCNEQQKQRELQEMIEALENIKIENRKIQKEKEEAMNKNDEISKALMDKVENLLSQNKEYQDMLINKQTDKFKQMKKDKEITQPFLYTQKKEPLTQYHNNLEPTVEVNDFYNESFKTVNEEQDILEDTYKYTKMDDMNYARKQNNKHNDVFRNAGELKIADTNNSTMFYDNNFNGTFKLENEYELTPTNNKLRTNTYENKFNANRPIGLRFYKTKEKENNLKTKDYDLNTKDYNMKINERDLKTKESNMKTKDEPDNKIVMESNNKITTESDKVSVESSKSVKTTSSLKNMIQKTVDLQNKFDTLEKQLQEINESELPKTKKLQDQIRAYTDYYYSNYLDFSNENDIL